MNSFSHHMREEVCDENAAPKSLDVIRTTHTTVERLLLANDHKAPSEEHANHKSLVYTKQASKAEGVYCSSPATTPPPPPLGIQQASEQASVVSHHAASPLYIHEDASQADNCSGSCTLDIKQASPVKNVCDALTLYSKQEASHVKHVCDALTHYSKQASHADTDKAAACYSENTSEKGGTTTYKASSSAYAKATDLEVNTYTNEEEAEASVFAVEAAQAAVTEVSSSSSFFTETLNETDSLAVAALATEAAVAPTKAAAETKAAVEILPTKPAVAASKAAVSTGATEAITEPVPSVATEATAAAVARGKTAVVTREGIADRAAAVESSLRMCSTCVTAPYVSGGGAAAATVAGEQPSLSCARKRFSLPSDDAMDLYEGCIAESRAEERALLYQPSSYGGSTTVFGECFDNVPVPHMRGAAAAAAVGSIITTTTSSPSNEENANKVVLSTAVIRPHADATAGMTAATSASIPSKTIAATATTSTITTTTTTTNITPVGADDGDVARGRGVASLPPWYSTTPTIPLPSAGSRIAMPATPSYYQAPSPHAASASSAATATLSSRSSDNVSLTIRSCASATVPAPAAAAAALAAPDAAAALAAPAAIDGASTTAMPAALAASVRTSTTAVAVAPAGASTATATGARAAAATSPSSLSPLSPPSPVRGGSDLTTTISAKAVRSPPGTGGTAAATSSSVSCSLVLCSPPTTVGACTGSWPQDSTTAVVDTAATLITVTTHAHTTPAASSSFSSFSSSSFSSSCCVDTSATGPAATRSPSLTFTSSFFAAPAEAPAVVARRSSHVSSSSSFFVTSASTPAFSSSSSCSCSIAKASLWLGLDISRGIPVAAHERGATTLTGAQEQGKCFLKSSRKRFSCLERVDLPKSRATVAVAAAAAAAASAYESPSFSTTTHICCCSTTADALPQPPAAYYYSSTTALADTDSNATFCMGYSPNKCSTTGSVSPSPWLSPAPENVKNRNKAAAFLESNAASAPPITTPPTYPSPSCGARDNDGGGGGGGGGGSCYLDSTMDAQQRRRRRLSMRKHHKDTFSDEHYPRQERSVAPPLAALAASAAGATAAIRAPPAADIITSKGRAQSNFCHTTGSLLKRPDITAKSAADVAIKLPEHAVVVVAVKPSSLMEKTSDSNTGWRPPAAAALCSFSKHSDYTKTASESALAAVGRHRKSFDIMGGQKSYHRISSSFLAEASAFMSPETPLKEEAAAGGPLTRVTHIHHSAVDDYERAADISRSATNIHLSAADSSSEGRAADSPQNADNLHQSAAESHSSATHIYSSAAKNNIYHSAVTGHFNAAAANNNNNNYQNPAAAAPEGHYDVAEECHSAAVVAAAAWKRSASGYLRDIRAFGIHDLSAESPADQQTEWSAAGADAEEDEIMQRQQQHTSRSSNSSSESDFDTVSTGRNSDSNRTQQSIRSISRDGEQFKSSPSQSSTMPRNGDVGISNTSYCYCKSRLQRHTWCAFHTGHHHTPGSVRTINPVTQNSYEHQREKLKKPSRCFFFYNAEDQLWGPTQHSTLCTTNFTSRRNRSDSRKVHKDTSLRSSQNTFYRVSSTNTSKSTSPGGKKQFPDKRDRQKSHSSFYYCNDTCGSGGLHSKREPVPACFSNGHSDTNSLFEILTRSRLSSSDSRTSGDYFAGSRLWCGGSEKIGSISSSSSVCTRYRTESTRKNYERVSRGRRSTSSSKKFSTDSHNLCRMSSVESNSSGGDENVVHIQNSINRFENIGRNRNTWVVDKQSTNRNSHHNSNNRSSKCRSSSSSSNTILLDWRDQQLPRRTHPEGDIDRAVVTTTPASSTCNSEKDDPPATISLSCRSSVRCITGSTVREISSYTYESYTQRKSSNSNSMNHRRYSSNKAYTICGTPEYLPPEVLLATGHDTKADCWTLGILLYEMFTGETPFYHENVQQMYENILHAPLVIPSHLSPAAKDLLKQLLQRQPSKRPAMHAIKSHPFFSLASFDWNAAEAGHLTPPFVPSVRSAGDACMFDEYPDSLEDDDQQPLTAEEEDTFKDF